MKKAAAMAAMGMMTAMAIFPPELNPELPEPEPDALRAEGVGDAREVVVIPVAVLVRLEVSGCWVEVTTMTEGVVTGGVVGAVVGVRVVVEVTSMILSLVVGATNVVEGGSEVVDVTVGGSGVGVVVGSPGVDVEVSVMVMVVVGEVVKLTDVVVMVVMLTESVGGSLVVGTDVSVVLSATMSERVSREVRIVNIPAIVRSEGEGEQFGSSGRVGSQARSELNSPARQGGKAVQRDFRRGQRDL